MNRKTRYIKQLNEEIELRNLMNKSINGSSINFINENKNLASNGSNCSENAIKVFHTNMFTEINGTGSAGGTPEGFAGVVQGRVDENPSWNKYYCDCMTPKNYKQLGLDTTNTKFNGFQAAWKKQLGCVAAKPKTQWVTTCDGSEGKPFKKLCKSETVRKVQGCLGIKADSYFGSGTATAVKNKLGRDYFTNQDINTLCPPATPPPALTGGSGAKDVQQPEAVPEQL